MTAQKIIHDQLFLRQKSDLAGKNDLQVAINLRDTLLANRGKAAGLAANMIGQTKQIIAFYAGPLPFVMLNPRIIQKKQMYLASEGCLSLEGERNVQRYEEITVTYQNMELETVTQTFDDFIAETIQHEIDHCNGILI